MIRDAASSQPTVATWPVWLPVPAERDFASVHLKVPLGTRCYAAIGPAATSPPEAQVCFLG